MVPCYPFQQDAEAESASEAPDYHTKPTVPKCSEPCPYDEESGEIERLDNYLPGEYHPVELGDKLQGRYRIVDKIDFGFLLDDMACSR